jgi:hypothetical protein
LRKKYAADQARSGTCLTLSLDAAPALQIYRRRGYWPVLSSYSLSKPRPATHAVRIHYRTGQTGRRRFYGGARPQPRFLVRRVWFRESVADLMERNLALRNVTFPVAASSVPTGMKLGRIYLRVVPRRTQRSHGGSRSNPGAATCSADRQRPEIRGASRRVQCRLSPCTLRVLRVETR